MAESASAGGSGTYSINDSMFYAPGESSFISAIETVKTQDTLRGLKVCLSSF